MQKDPTVSNLFDVTCFGVSLLPEKYCVFCLVGLGPETLASGEDSQGGWRAPLWAPANSGDKEAGVSGRKNKRYVPSPPPQRQLRKDFSSLSSWVEGRFAVPWGGECGSLAVWDGGCVMAFLSFAILWAAVGYHLSAHEARQRSGQTRWELWKERLAVPWQRLIWGLKP